MKLQWSHCSREYVALSCMGFMLPMMVDHGRM
jgi:hypothetical protein